jgi:lysophospholipase L1-like esterase
LVKIIAISVLGLQLAPLNPRLNTWLKSYCSENGIVFIDVNQVLETNGALSEDYAYDGVHLLGTGYKKWGELIMPIIGSD